MKNIYILFLVALLFNGCGKSPQDNQSQTPKDTQNSPSVSKLCEAWGKVAAKIMESRQAGMPMSTLMEISKEDKTQQALIVKAYEHPHLQTKEYIQKSIGDFRDEVYLDCFKKSEGMK